jgi:hypothetical protein
VGGLCFFSKKNILIYKINCTQRIPNQLKPFNLKGGLWFLVSFRNFFGDNTSLNIFILSRKARNFFQNLTPSNYHAITFKNLTQVNNSGSCEPLGDFFYLSYNYKCMCFCILCRQLILYPLLTIACVSFVDN